MTTATLSYRFEGLVCGDGDAVMVLGRRDGCLYQIAADSAAGWALAQASVFTDGGDYITFSAEPWQVLGIVEEPEMGAHIYLPGEPPTDPLDQPTTTTIADVLGGAIQPPMLTEPHQRESGFWVSVSTVGRACHHWHRSAAVAADCHPAGVTVTPTWVALPYPIHAHPSAIDVRIKGKDCDECHKEA